MKLTSLRKRFSSNLPEIFVLRDTAADIAAQCSLTFRRTVSVEEQGSTSGSSSDECGREHLHDLSYDVAVPFAELAQAYCDEDRLHQLEDPYRALCFLADNIDKILCPTVYTKCVS